MTFQVGGGSCGPRNIFNLRLLTGIKRTPYYLNKAGTFARRATKLHPPSERSALPDLGTR